MKMKKKKKKMMKKKGRNQTNTLPQGRNQTPCPRAENSSVLQLLHRALSHRSHLSSGPRIEALSALGAVVSLLPFPTNILEEWAEGKALQ